MTRAGAPNLHVGIALDGAGWHPAAWREEDAEPEALLSASYWIRLVQEAERGLLDFVTFEDSLRLQSDHPFRPDERTDRVRGHLDAVLTAARVAPVTSHIGLVPTVVVTHTEPFHVSKAIATLDYVSKGRAGVRVKVSSRPDEAGHFGRRRFPPVDLTRRDAPEVAALLADLVEEASDYVEVVRRLWDSWEDDAEIRDVATGRFVDREKLHYIDFEGRFFSVRGPSITPRPPQGQPLVAALAHGPQIYRLAASSADLVFVTPGDTGDAAGIVEEVSAEVARGDRAGDVSILADLVVFLGATAEEARSRKERLDDLAGAAYRSDARIFVGTPAGLADLIEGWAASGLDGLRLRPASLPRDLTQITEGLIPELRRRGLFRSSYGEPTLRSRFGLERPPDRYAGV